MQSLGDRVMVGGTSYRIVGKQHAGGSGSKFWGKFRFRLRNDAGEEFTAFGKNVAHNSRLTPVA